MELVWQTNAWEDYLYWQEQDKKIRSPFKDLGKPEPLKGGLLGFWSRHITESID
jgi:toxin YoeB